MHTYNEKIIPDEFFIGKCLGDFMLYARGTFQLNSTTYSNADRVNFALIEYPVIDTHVVVVTDNSDASAWISARGLTTISQSDAQALIDAKVAQAQSQYDARSTESKLIDWGGKPRPQGLTLP